jgi:hypothetical protein
MRQRVLTRLGGSVSAAALMLGGAWLWVSTPATAAPQSQQFDFTGAAQTFTVPANVCQVTVDAFGAAGGGFTSGQENNQVAGGLGGRTTATIAVTPGELLQVNVGGRGADASDEETPMAVVNGGPGSSVRFGVVNPGALGGFNGGGDGGSDTSDDPGAGGGGASDVRQGGTALGDRVVVAGGAGGAGGNDDGGAGGAGGGGTGGDGSAGDAPFGAGGTQTTGGAGGSNGAASGENGTAGVGGTGGTGSDGGGGGAGGGLFGGGAGAGDSSAGESDGGGGGGGGSGSGPAGVAFETGVRSGDGVVTISFDPEAGGCPAPGAVAVVAEPRFTG